MELEEVEADIANVRTAWRYYLVQNNLLQLWKFTNGLWYVYWIRWWNHTGMELFAEAARLLQEVQDEDGIALRATAMAFQAYFMAWLGLAEDGMGLASELLGKLERKLPHDTFKSALARSRDLELESIVTHLLGNFG